MVVNRRQFHEEIVRMLPVVQVLSVICLSCLEQQRAATRSDREGLRAGHSAKAEHSATHGTTGFDHPPIHAPRLPVPAPGTRVVVLEKCDSVQPRTAGIAAHGCDDAPAKTWTISRATTNATARRIMPRNVSDEKESSSSSGTFPAGSW